MAENSVVNLTLHGIGRAHHDRCPAERRFWISADRFERVLDAVGDLPDTHITFDDGNSSDIEIAMPLLLERGLTATFFVIAGLLGDPGRLSAEDVEELAASGMTIGSHGWEHRDWRAVDDVAARDELDGSLRRLRDITGTPVSDVAIPFGSYDRRVLGRLRRAQVARVFTSDGGRADPRSWIQPRTSLTCDTDPAELRHWIRNGELVARKARRMAATWVKMHRG